MKPLRILLIVVTCGAIGTWMLTLRSDRPDDASSPRQDEAPKSTIANAEIGANGTELDMGSEVTAPELAARVPVEDPEAASQLARGTAEQRAEFEKKYAGKSRLELEMALGALTPVRRELQKSLTASRRSAGLFTRVYPSDNAQLNLTELGKTEADRTIPNPMGFHAGTVRGGDENGRPYVELVTLPHGCYPEFDALQAQELWLYDHILKSH